MQDGVEIHNIAVGHGRRVKKGDRVTMNFKGRIDPEERKAFDKSKVGKPFSFIVGSKKIIKGVSIGVTGMTMNSKRELVIPSSLGFGKTGLLDKVPPNTTLYYDVEIVDVQPSSMVEKERRDYQKSKRRKQIAKMRNQESYVKDYDFIEVDE
jgi:FKBP-type peptidyl-prolyl cis-trans isomerase